MLVFDTDWLNVYYIYFNIKLVYIKWFVNKFKVVKRIKIYLIQSKNVKVFISVVDIS